MWCALSIVIYLFGWRKNKVKKAMFAVVNDSSAPAFVICSHPPKADLTQLGGLYQHGIWAFIHVLKFQVGKSWLLKIRASTRNENVGKIHFFSKTKPSWCTPLSRSCADFSRLMRCMPSIPLSPLLAIAGTQECSTKGGSIREASCRGSRYNCFSGFSDSIKWIYMRLSRGINR